MNYIRSHGVLLWSEVVVDWLSVGTWFGIIIALVARVLAYGLGHPLSVAQATWFGIPNVCGVKGEWVEHVTEDHGIHDGNDV